MRVLNLLLKTWICAFVLFIVGIFIMPRSRPFASGEIYVVNENNKSYPNHKPEKPTLILNEINSNLLNKKILDWKEKNKLKSIVFLVPRYQVIIFYFNLKKQSTLLSEDYSLAVYNENFSLKNLFMSFHETIGIVIEYFIDSILKRYRSVFHKK